MDHVPTYEDIPIIEALWIAALVRYGRQLATGVREGLPVEVIKSLTPKQQERHEYFMGLRNGWIAHSISYHEDNRVQLRLNPPSRGKRVTGVEVVHSKTIALGLAQANELVGLIDAILEAVHPIVEAERSKVLELARSLPVEDLYANIQHPAPVPPIPNPKKGRKKWEPLTRRCS